VRHRLLTSAWYQLRHIVCPTRTYHIPRPLSTLYPWPTHCPRPRTGSGEIFSLTLGSAQPRADRIRSRFPSTSKNTAGYALNEYLRTRDVLDLVIGSEGTLGFVTRAELASTSAPPPAV
jgi:hypothetical protein